MSKSLEELAMEFVIMANSTEPRSVAKCNRLHQEICLRVGIMKTMAYISSATETYQMIVQGRGNDGHSDQASS